MLVNSSLTVSHWREFLLHPMVCVYTLKCATNIVEKYEPGSGVAEIFTTSVSVLKHQRTDCDKLQAPQWVNMDIKVHVSVLYSTCKPCK